MATETDIVSFKVINQDFVKLDRFNGTNFNRWQDKMMFLLTALKILYVLDPKLQPFLDPSNADTYNIRIDRKKREEDELICRGYILNTLSDRFYDLFTSMKLPREIWKTLEFKYNTEKQGTGNYEIF